MYRPCSGGGRRRPTAFALVAAFAAIVSATPESEAEVRLGPKSDVGSLLEVRAALSSLPYVSSGGMYQESGASSFLMVAHAALETARGCADDRLAEEGDSDGEVAANAERNEHFPEIIATRRLVAAPMPVPWLTW
eukprot:TRINITY_DN10726_c0_g1_i1.p2 TRINITY_DN10726_c0_g1~~TRINITY_DN10726_c0_g1_i1.p2  ORF type:complete len:135 (-),score=31.33 TRINITY_DN10726_c0_g1_i1:58-462(-)